jgi:hypothetical protein
MICTIYQRFGVLVLSIMLCASFATAQTTSTELLGTVTDPSGGVIPGASVTLLRVETNERRNVITSNSGNYSFPLIEPGEYRITVESPGFQRLEKTGIRVELQQKARVDFQLVMGSPTETVEVVAQVIQLKTEDAAVGQVIDNKRVVELPLNGRNISALAVLTAGVQFGSQRSGEDGQGGQIPGRMVAVYANGQRSVGQQVTLDGVIVTGSQNNMAAFTPSVDAVEEFKVQTSSYSAEYGQSTGAVVQIAMKGGTNQFHGTIFEFLRNDALAAKDYFLNFQLPAGTRELPRSVLRRNQFGTFLGGPVNLGKLYNGTNKTFWSFSYEGTRYTQENPSETYNYPAAFRNGDFSSLLAMPLGSDGKPIRSPVIIYDPLTGEPFRDSAGNITNIIPSSRINKSAQKFINDFQPLPMFTRTDPLDNNSQVNVATIVRSNQYFFRIDHNFSSNDKVFVRWLTDREISPQPSTNPYFLKTYRMAPTTIATQWVHIFNPTTLNEFRFGYYHSVESDTNPRSNTDFDLDTLGIGKFRMVSQGNRKMTSVETGIPHFSGLSNMPGDRDNSEPGYAYATQLEFSDNMTIVRGNHGIKTGWNLRRPMLHAGSSNDPRGVIGTSGNVGGYALSGWLMGFVSSTQTVEGLANNDGRQNRWSAYVLDDWKATRRLTINYGLRWDFFQAPYDKYGAWRNLRFDILSTGADGKQYPTQVPAPYTNGVRIVDSDNRYFMPRVGIAYRPTDQWVVRMGAGWFVSGQQMENFNIIGRTPPNGGSYSFTQITDVALRFNYLYAGQTYAMQTRKIRAGTDVLGLDNMFPSEKPAGSRVNILMMPFDNRYANSYQWSMDVQRALPFSMFFSIGYVGSSSHHLDSTITGYNQAPISTNTDVNSRRRYQAYVSMGEGNTVLPLGTIRYLDSFANSNYNALQVLLEKRYGKGLSFGFNYTYSRALGDNGGGDRNGGAGSQQDVLNRAADYGPLTFDLAHAASANFVYEMPFLNRFKGIAGAFLAGWQTNGIVTLKTGLPFTPSGGSDTNTGMSGRPDRIADGRLDTPTREKWFDPLAFSRVTCNNPARLDLCHYGNAGAYILRRPGVKTLDLSLYKNWALKFMGDQGRMQFRMETFNTLNTPQFGSPNNIGWTLATSVTPDSTRMGEIRGLALPMRIVQFGLKLYF